MYIYNKFKISYLIIRLPLNLIHKTIQKIYFIHN